MLTAEQRTVRADKLGSSDSGAVMGVDPFKSKGDVWLIKTGQAPDFEGNEATARGNLLEEPLVKFAEQELGKPAERSKLFIHPSNVLCANLDAMFSPVEIIEAKSTVMGEEWGEEGTDQVPDRVQVQVAHQFVCVPTARVCWIPVLLPGYKRFDWRLYQVERNDKLCAMVEERGIEFMEKYVKLRIQPDDFKPTLEVLKRIRRQPNKIVPLDDELIDGLIVARAVNRDAEDKAKEAEAAVLAALGDAEAGEGSKTTVTYLEVSRKGYEVKPTTYRSLKTKERKV